MDVDKKGLKDHILKYFVIAIFSWLALSTTMFYSTSTSLFYNIDQEEFAALNNLVKKQDNETAFLSESNKILTRHSERINKFMDKNLSISDIYTIKSELDQEYKYLKKYNLDELRATQYFYSLLADLLKKESLMWNELKDQLLEDKDKCCIIYNNTYTDYKQSFYSLQGASNGLKLKLEEESKIVKAVLDNYSSKLEKKIFDYKLSLISLVLSFLSSGFVIWYLYFSKKE